MVAIKNIIKGKNKIIISALAGALSALIFLTAIDIAIKTAIIVSATIVTYLLLSVIQKVRAGKNDVSTKTEEQSDILGDEGYDSANESENEDKAKEAIVIPAKTKKQSDVSENEGYDGNKSKDEDKAEDRERSEREQKRMESRSLGGPINVFGETIPAGVDNTEESHSVDWKEGIVVPYCIVPENQRFKQESYVPMKSLPEHIDAFGNALGNLLPPQNNLTNIKIKITKESHSPIIN